MSGIKSVVLNYRLDGDGENPIEDTANEVYYSGMLAIARIVVSMHWKVTISFRYISS